MPDGNIPLQPVKHFIFITMQLEKRIYLNVMKITSIF